MKLRNWNSEPPKEEHKKSPASRMLVSNIIGIGNQSTTGHFAFLACRMVYNETRKPKIGTYDRASELPARRM